MDDKARIEALASALRYALTKRGSAFDYDVWAEMARNAIDGVPSNSALDNEIAVNAKLRQALDKVRAERDEFKDRLKQSPCDWDRY